MLLIPGLANGLLCILYDIKCVLYEWMLLNGWQTFGVFGDG